MKETETVISLEMALANVNKQPTYSVKQNPTQTWIFHIEPLHSHKKKKKNI